MMPSSAPTQAFSINLTRDELLALLQLMGSTTMNGLPEDPFAGISRRERAERLNAGLETLLNRGLIEAQGGDSVVIDDTLVALVGSCVLPGASMVLSGLQPDGIADPHFFNATPEILVEHSSPRPGIHIFTFLPDEVALAERVQWVLAAIGSAHHGADFAIVSSDKLIADVFRWSRNNQTAKAADSLVKANWPAGEAQSFVRSCAGFAIYTGLCAWGLRSEQIEGTHTLIAVSDQQRCWLLEPQGERGDLLRCRSVTGQDATDAMVRMAHPLLQIANAGEK
ncbi:MAG: hypothetical protein IAE85_21175 [Anaerolinea sp.]|nr:hypothetical protein [Anaerolinea sp.]HRI56039.1 hypothetical protein [Anaerolineae bacterium]